MTGPDRAHSGSTVTSAYVWGTLAVAFALELCALAAFAVWGVHVGGTGVGRLLLGAGLSVVAAVVWGAFASPRPAVPLPAPAVVAVRAGFFGAAALALAGSGHPRLALAYTVLVVLNTVQTRLPPVRGDATAA